MAKLFLLRGLPASGKTLYSAQLVIKGCKRISPDDLRTMVDNGVYSKQNEMYITDVVQTMVALALQSNLDVCLDSNNLNPYWVKWARTVCRDLRCELEIIDFETPLSVCIERDLQRTKDRVGKDVIVKLYNKWFVNGKFPEVPE